MLTQTAPGPKKQPGKVDLNLLYCLSEKPGCGRYMWNSIPERCGSRNFVKCVCQSREADTNTRIKTYLDFVRVPPVLFENIFNCHVARQDHHVAVTLPAAQLTLLTCVSVWTRRSHTRGNNGNMCKQLVNDLSFKHSPALFHRSLSNHVLLMCVQRSIRLQRVAVNITRWEWEEWCQQWATTACSTKGEFTANNAITSVIIKVNCHYITVNLCTHTYAVSPLA